MSTYDYQGSPESVDRLRPVRRVEAITLQKTSTRPHDEAQAVEHHKEGRVMMPMQSMRS